MKKRSFVKKVIPLAIVVLFVVVAFSPIYVHSHGTSSAHEYSVKSNHQTNSPSSNPSYSNAGYVKYTLNLSSNSLLNGNVVLTSLHFHPHEVAYDSSNQYLYIVNGYSGNVTVVNGATNRIVQNITVGKDPSGVVYDPSNQYVYVTDYCSDNVTVINSTTNTIVKNIVVGLSLSSIVLPEGIAYDPSNNYIYVTDCESDNVSVINGANDTFIGNITVGSWPAYVSYDPANNYVYVSDLLSDNVSVINGANDTFIGNITVGISPKDIAYDPANKYMYVGNGLNNVTVISSATDKIVKTIFVSSHPRDLAYDPLNQYMYVTDYDSSNVSVINSTTNAVVQNIAVGTSPSGIAYDPSNHDLYVVNSGSGSLTIIGNTYYTVTFTETGLPSGTAWYVNLTDGVKSGAITGNSYTFELTNGTYPYTIQTANKLYGPSQYPALFTVKGSDIKETVKFSREYYATFTETGLPTGTAWYVNGTDLSGYANSPGNITLSVTNGTYTFTITNLSSYYTSTSHLPVNIDGKNVTETVNYSHWAYITGTISPGSATLTINGITVPVSSSGHFNDSVATGTYYIVASESGHQTYHKNLTLSSGSAQRVTISLKPLSKSSAVSSTEMYVIIGIVAVIGVIAGVLVIVLKRR